MICGPNFYPLTFLKSWSAKIWNIFILTAIIISKLNYSLNKNQKITQINPYIDCGSSLNLVCWLFSTFYYVFLPFILGWSPSVYTYCKLMIVKKNNGTSMYSVLDCDESTNIISFVKLLPIYSYDQLLVHNWLLPYP